MCPEALLPPEVTSLAWLSSQDGTVTRNKAGNRHCVGGFICFYVHICTPGMSQWYTMSQIMLYTHAPRQESGGSVLNIPLLVKEKDPNGSCLPHPSHRQSVPPLPWAHDGEIWVVAVAAAASSFLLTHTCAKAKKQQWSHSLTAATWCPEPNWKVSPRMPTIA